MHFLQKISKLAKCTNKIPKFSIKVIQLIFKTSILFSPFISSPITALVDLSVWRDICWVKSQFAWLIFLIWFVCVELQVCSEYLWHQNSQRGPICSSYKNPTVKRKWPLQLVSDRWGWNKDILLKNQSHAQLKNWKEFTQKILGLQLNRTGIPQRTILCHQTL